MTSSDKKPLSSVLKNINKDIGERALVKLSDDIDQTIPRIPTGVLAVDKVLGGGLPVGKNIEIFGAEGSGKTAIALKYIAQAQKEGVCVLLDLENAFDPQHAASSGVKLDELFLSQPDSAENALEIIERCLDASDVSAIVVDSVAGLVPNAELLGDYGDSHVGLAARLMSQALRKITAKQRTEGSDTTILWINQLREKIGGASPYGPQTTTTGGRALKFYSSVRMEVSRIKNLTQGDEVIGHTVKVKTVKNRFAPPFQIATFDIMYDSGISNESTLVDLSIENGLIEKGGAWYTILKTGEKVQGRNGVLEAIRNDPELYHYLESELV